MSERSPGFLEAALIALVSFAGGVAVGMLFAPKSGEDNRRWIKDQAGHLKDKAVDFGHHAEDRIHNVVEKMTHKKVKPVGEIHDENEIYNEDETVKR